MATDRYTPATWDVTVPRGTTAELTYMMLDDEGLSVPVTTNAEAVIAFIRSRDGRYSTTITAAHPGPETNRCVFLVPHDIFDFSGEPFQRDIKLVWSIVREIASGGNTGQQEYVQGEFTFTGSPTGDLP